MGENNGKRDIGSTDRVVCFTIVLLHGIRNYTVYEEKVIMRVLFISILCVSLMGCANARFASNDTQCKRNPAVDGVAVAALTGLPLLVVATPPIGIGVAALMGGSYYVAHEAVCR